MNSSRGGSQFSELRYPPAVQQIGQAPAATNLTVAQVWQLREHYSQM